jgi:type VI secretion system protein ImpA
MPDSDSSEDGSGSLDLSSIPTFSGSDDVAAHLAAICKYLRDKDPSEVPAYTVIRGYRFGELRSNAPPVIYSMLEPPASDIRMSLKSNLNNGDWPAVLEASEAAAALPCGRGWLDLHRYTATALRARGFESAANAVKSLVRGLVQDLPDLLEMSFLDDTPVANQETKAWIEKLLSPPPVEAPAAESSSDGTSSDDSTDTSSDFSLSLDDTPVDTDAFSLGDSSTDLTAALASSEPTAASVPDFSTLAVSLEPVPEMVVMDPVPEPEAEPEPDVFEAALASARDGQLSESVGMLVKSQAKERSNRARFKRKTQIAHILVAGEKQSIARPLLEEIVEEIATRRLEEWEEAQVLAYPVELLMRCLGQSDPTKKSELYDRLCKLDPLRALKAFSDHA